MKRLLLCSIIFFSLTGIARADDANPQHLVVGLGVKPCSFYIENKDNFVMKSMIYSWVQGAITGIDGTIVAFSKKEALINKIQTNDVLFSTFDNLCRSKPDTTIDNVVQSTYSALLQQ